MSQSRYTCWNGRAEVPLTDYLSSPNNALSESDTSGPIFSDAAPWKPQPLSPGGSAGLAIGLLAAAALLGTLGYFVGYKRLWLERRAKQFERFEDGGGGGGGGQVVGGGGGNGLLSGGGVGPVNGSSSAGYSGSGANGFGGGGASNGGGNGYSSGGIDGGGKYAASPAVLQLSALPADNAPPQR